jgi:hypothetical protein
MSGLRNGVRVTCDARCILNLGNSQYEGILEDLSISGARVRITENQAEVIQAGYKCGLYLCHDPNVCPGECACHIVRVAEEYVGVAFVKRSETN